MVATGIRQSGSRPAAPRSNRSGRVTRQEQQSTNGARRYTHDAWGRLVKVESVNTATQVVMTCPPNPDPATMRVPTAAGSGQETLDHEADKAFGGADREQAA